MEECVEEREKRVTKVQYTPHGCLGLLPKHKGLLRLQRQWEDIELPPFIMHDKHGLLSLPQDEHILRRPTCPQRNKHNGASVSQCSLCRCGFSWMGRRPLAASTVHTTPRWYCPQSHRCLPRPVAPRTDWTAAPLEGIMDYQRSVQIFEKKKDLMGSQHQCFYFFTYKSFKHNREMWIPQWMVIINNNLRMACISMSMKVKTWWQWVKPMRNNFSFTRDGVSQLLPVTPDISCPHSREASDAREGGAGEDKGSLPLYLY